MRHFEYFNKADVQKIHAATLYVLEKVGVDFGYEPALKVLAKGGCKVEGERVFFPSKLVEAFVAKAPGQFTLYARNPEKNVIIGCENTAFAPCYGPAFVTDLDRGRRSSTLEDFHNFAKLSHASHNIDINGGILVEPNDVPMDKRAAEMLYGVMRYSDKPFMGSATGKAGAQKTIAMSAIMLGVSEERLADKPPSITLQTARTPLGYDDRMLGAMMEYAKAGMAQVVSSLAIAGATAPVTMEGTLVIQNAEVLAGIVLTQMLREGAPVVFGGSSSAAAMRYGTLSVGAPEMVVNTAATAQMARFYSIPSRGGGALTDAKIPDAQAGMESMMSQMMASMAGVHFVLHSAGILEGYMTSSYEKFIMDDDICGMCKRIRRGETVNIEKLAVDLIEEVGPGGEYLTQMHTFQNFRKEFYAPILEERGTYDAWEANGRLTLAQQANAKWKDILATFEAPDLPADVDRDLKKFIDRI